MAILNCLTCLAANTSGWNTFVMTYRTCSYIHDQQLDQLQSQARQNSLLCIPTTHSATAHANHSNACLLWQITPTGSPCQLTTGKCSKPDVTKQCSQQKVHNSQLELLHSLVPSCGCTAAEGSLLAIAALLSRSISSAFLGWIRGCTIIVTDPLYTLPSSPLGISLPVPINVTGTTGTFALAAMLKAPCNTAHIVIWHSVTPTIRQLLSRSALLFVYMIACNGQACFCIPESCLRRLFVLPS